ncbi:glycoside hydrolase [Ceraceosorus guamensis]|uniref:glucan endo-1,3-beta-D-glucosidase n=1 Tax=Ceraceosorus guamensis TaxID=1522189 RepID=A0A316VYB3_9BASI|nr:glycoside hydrolase [Ceraceosorus guamensis]PWN41898.1 glycoside hydrolase [Ceraceosorus guamensis]
MPDKVPSSLDNWWCNAKDEYAFMGFSYSIASCPSYDQLVKDFKRQRNTYQARYVRLYSNCDKQGYNDDLINAAWEAGVGLLPLIWFGFDGDESYRPRKKALLQTIKSNPKAPFVVRTVQFGSEPLFDWAISADGLADQINDVKQKLSQFITGQPTAMQVSTSEMPYGYQIHGNAPKVFSSVSTLLANSLPFFAQDASTARKAFSHVTSDLNYLKKQGPDKKIIITQTGWPSNADVWKANSAAAQANVAQSKAYFDLLDDKCEDFKQGPKGGVGWFAHIWSDDGLPGWGVVGYDGKAKFEFKARTTC